MKKLSLSLLCVGALICGVVQGLPTGQERVKRDADNSTVVSTEGSSSSVATEGSTAAVSTSSSTTTESSEPSRPPPSQGIKNDFGIGAAAGFGGLTRGIGLGNFRIPTAAENKNDPLAPWGAFAGFNLGSGGRVGAGCQGLSCGVQLGNLVLGTPQLLGIGRHFLNPNLRQNGAAGKKSDETENLSETNLFVNANPGNPNNFSGSNDANDEIRLIFRDAFRGFRDTLQSFFRAPVTHFIKKNPAYRIDNSTASVVGPVRSAASEPKTYRIQLTRPSSTTEKENKEAENELD